MYRTYWCLQYLSACSPAEVNPTGLAFTPSENYLEGGNPSEEASGSEGSSQATIHWYLHMLRLAACDMI
jgi:hypothetical protein